MAGGTSQRFQDVWGTSATDVYLVDGQDGTIVRGVRGASVVVTPSSHGFTAVGQTVQLDAEALDASSSPVSGVTFEWSSSVQSVATVDAAGLVIAVGSGATTITATAPGGAAGTATVSVIPPDALDLSDPAPIYP